MRSPKDMEIIQIDITNACPHNCSNCTRLCGQHKEPFFMDFETFKKAVDSLKDYKGIVGVMGGEPTLHPEFEKFVEYYKSQRPDFRPRTQVKFPTASFKEYVQRFVYRRGRKRAVFSAMGSGYYKHFELIQDTFPYQGLNDHRQPNHHQGILITRKELGIPDDEWIKQRDNCWIQNLWSASITPKGAFFCEVAAAMDMLFDGPGGWPVDSDWWKRKPEDFKDQLHWCEYCSLALDVPSILATEKTDLISKEMEEKLLAINGWKMQTKHYKVFNPEEYSAKDKHAYDKSWYLPGNNEDLRVSEKESSLFPKAVDIAVLEGTSENATISVEQLQNLDFKDFVIVFPNEKAFSSDIVDKMKKCIFNPGYFYYSKDGIWIFNRRANALKTQKSIVADKKLSKLWPKAKRSKVCMKKLGCATLGQKLGQYWAMFIHRGAFLIPLALCKKTKKD